MRDKVMCWAPECAEIVDQPDRGRVQRYHTKACRQKALRRNGGTAPTEPFLPLLPTPAVAPTVVAPPENSVPPVSRPLPASVGGPTTGGAELGATAHTETTVAPKRKRRSRPAPTDRNQGAPGTSGPAAPAAEVESAPAPAQATQLHVVVTEDSTVPVTIKVHPLVAAYKRDLERIGQTETRQGLQVVELAEKLVSSATSPAAAASISKELERLLSELEQNTPKALAERDPSLLIRERTLAKLRAVDAAS